MTPSECVVMSIGPLISNLDDVQNTVPSLTMVRGGPPSARFSRAIRRPAAQVPPSSTLASGSSSAVAAEPLADGAADLVEQRHRQARAIRRPASTPTSCARILSGLVRQREHAAVEEEPAIAVFGQAGEVVDVDAPRFPPIAAARSASRSAIARACGRAPARPSALPGAIAGWRQVSPSATPASVRRDGQMPPKVRQHLGQHVAGADGAGLGHAMKPVEQIARARSRPWRSQLLARAG